MMTKGTRHDFQYTDDKGGFFTVSELAENEVYAYNTAKNELSRHNGLMPSPCKLYKIDDFVVPYEV